jgi:hypothetical protein
LLVGIVGIALGTVPGGYCLPPLLSIVAGPVVLFVLPRVIGRRADCRRQVIRPPEL